MNKKIDESFEDVFAELEMDPDFQKAERKLKPYYDIVIDMINLRSRLGLTQKELADKAGTYQSRISKIESGEFDFRMSTLISIAEALDAEVAIQLVPLEWKARGEASAGEFRASYTLAQVLNKTEEYSEKPAKQTFRIDSVMAYE